MFGRRLFSAPSAHLLGTSGLLLAASPVIKSHETPDTQDNSNKILCRPSELPVYSNKVSTVNKVKIDEPSELEKILIEPIGAVRSSVVGVLREAKDLSTKAGNTISESAENFNFIVAYLREEDNEAQRVGAVAMGTLTGFIFGLRGGIIKKLVYSLIGTGTMGAICFPEQTSKYTKEAATQGKLLTTIVYNFVYGIKPGDPQPDIKFPEISVPKNFDEFLGMVTNVGKSAKDAIMPPPTPEKTEETKKD